MQVVLEMATNALSNLGGPEQSGQYESSERNLQLMQYLWNTTK
jgi:hypothetical protein